ncbi:MAG: flagellar protein FliT [Planctomycetota bacterium]
MTASPDSQPTPGVHEMLVELEGVCEQMLELARRQEVESVLPLARTANQLIQRARGGSEVFTDDDQQRLAHIQDLQAHVRLALASQKQQTAEELAQLGHGRRSIHAYGDNGTQ